VKGAFTDAITDGLGCFELADGGTLFLDEIGTMPVGQQAKLLRVLQSGELQPVGSSRTRRVNVRVLSATNVDVGAEVTRGVFREDLLYRLNTVEIHLPPLRDRGEDVAALGAHFLSQQAARYSRAIRGFSPEAAAALAGHPWPGNVRELEHVIERAVVLAEGPLLEARDLHLRPPRSDGDAIERMTLADAEAHLIRKALERSGGNVVRAAEALGLSRSALYRRLSAMGIAVPE
jgi:DNA-binding NtrC family response regulator